MDQPVGEAFVIHFHLLVVGLGDGHDEEAARNRLDPHEFGQIEAVHAQDELLLSLSDPLGRDDLPLLLPLLEKLSLPVVIASPAPEEEEDVRVVERGDHERRVPPQGAQEMALLEGEDKLPLRPLCRVADRAVAVHVLEEKGDEYQTRRRGDQPLELFLDFLFAKKGRGEDVGALADQNKRLNLFGPADELLRHITSGPVQTEVSGVGDGAGGSVDNETVGAGDGMIDVDRLDLELADFQAIAGAKSAEADLAHVAVHLSVAGAGRAVQDELAGLAQIDRDCGVDEGDMIGVIGMHVGEHDGVDRLQFVRRGLELVDFLHRLDHSQFQEVLHFPRHQEGIGEKIGALGEALAEIEEDARVSVLKEDLVSPDLVHSAQECQLYHGIILAHLPESGAFCYDPEEEWRKRGSFP